MASQLRLSVLAPIALVAVLGLAVSTFVMSRSKPDSSEADAIATRIAARHETTTTTAGPKTQPTPTTPTKHQSPPATAHRSNPLTAALARHPVVVVLFYKPNVTYDAIQTREARAGALSTGAGFVTIDVSKNRKVGKLAAKYDVLESPTVLIFRRGPKLRTRLEGYHDRTTIIQAVRNA
ncbi:MAG TPA: hypothetical protein VFW80_02920 [Gaiellaceae bacterium]|nr:hypothetical protein [Gaiellaceae bacterium]